VTTTETIRTCVQNAERQVRMFSQRIQWTCRSKSSSWQSK